MTRRSRHLSAIPSMLHQSGTSPWPQLETCLRPAANACVIWHQQAPTQDHANLDCDQSTGRIRHFLGDRGGISIVLVARPHRIRLSKVTLGGFIALAMGSSVCFARSAVEHTTTSGEILARRR